MIDPRAFEVRLTYPGSADIWLCLEECVAVLRDASHSERDIEAMQLAVLADHDFHCDEFSVEPVRPETEKLP